MKELLDTCLGQITQDTRPVDKTRAGFVLRTVQAQIAISNRSLETDKHYQRLVGQCNKLLHDNWQKRSTNVWLGLKLVQILASSDWLVLKTNGANWTSALIGLLEQGNMEILGTLQLQAVKVLRLIFSLVAGKPDMSREIITPRLVAHAKAIIGLSKRALQCASTNTLNQALLNLRLLIFNHSTSFRPCAGQAQSLTTSVLENPALPRKTRFLAAEVLVSLHLTSPKATEASEWRAGFLSVLRETNELLDATLPHFVEEPSLQGRARTTGAPDLHQFGVKFKSLLYLLEAYISTKSKFRLQFPVGHVIKLICRLLDVSSQRPQPTTGLFWFSTVPELEQSAIHALRLTLCAVGSSVLVHHGLLLHKLHELVKNPALLRQRSTFVSAVFLACRDYLDLLAFSPSPPETDEGAFFKDLCKAAKRALYPAEDLPSTAAIPDLVSVPKEFARKGNQKLQTAALQVLTSVIQVCPNLCLSMRASVDSMVISLSLQYNSVGRGLASYLEISSVKPGSTTKYSIAPLAARIIPDSLVLDAIAHPALPPAAADLHTLRKSAVLHSPSSDVDSAPVSEDVEVHSHISIDSQGSSAVRGPQDPADVRDSDTIDGPEDPIEWPKDSIDTECKPEPVTIEDSHTVSVSAAGPKFVEAPIQHSDSSDSEMEIPEIVVGSDSELE